ncbi:CLUMA_CG001763, isoform A [Clunio marinus]|uniref:CLUMA_CG001763, isoform A n=1 Tax=Clunio marinus TaxID=568069 RepID=A0A1J1HP26_9DIPT|nr:CLUMA_CG001763, isoform A [Clunio marinus]
MNRDLPISDDTLKEKSLAKSKEKTQPPSGTLTKHRRILFFFLDDVEVSVCFQCFLEIFCLRQISFCDFSNQHQVKRDDKTSKLLDYTT